MLEVQFEDLLKAGVHFGHRVQRWNPKMEPYLFGARNGIHIIDLHKTLSKCAEAYNFICDTVLQGGRILFVATKKQVRNVVREAARSCDAYYVTHRWLGGMLTNFSTIRKSVERLKKIEAMCKEGAHHGLPKKEILRMEKERDSLLRQLEGVREMVSLPEAIFIVDIVEESTAVLEACRLGIPIVAIVDSNGNLDDVDYPIPGNDDAVKSVQLIVTQMAAAVIEGRKSAEAQRLEQLAMLVQHQPSQQEQQEEVSAASL